tara:strand:+ start:1616 stop:2500 length:885 start_codon:yes stop_codon:yes gene_type:complete
MVSTRKERFKKIALFSTTKNKRILSIANQCKEVLKNKGIKVLASINLKSIASKDLIIASEEEIVGESDLVIAIGGDGTMLSCSRRYGSLGIPVLGINLGNLGFLADLTPKNLTESLLNVLDGKFVEDKRFFIEANISEGESNCLALNEIVIHSGVIAQMIEYDLFIDGDFVWSQRSDGLIVSTNTGSTAYSLSGGGPIIHPSLEAFCILPMFPHSLSSSPLIVSSKSKISVILKKNSKKGKVSLDSGKIFPLKREQEVIMQQSKKFLKLIHPDGHNFYEAYRNKLGWGLGIIKD